MDPLDSIIAPSGAKLRLAALRKLVSVPEEVSVFYAFGAPEDTNGRESGPRSNTLLLEPRVEGWWRDYKRDNTRYRDDPVRRKLRRSVSPVLWNDLVPGGQIEQSQDELWETVRNHGIRAGLSVPLRDPRRRLHGSLAFVGFCDATLFDEWWQDMSLKVVGAAHLFHQGLIQTAGNRARLRMSPREGQCLSRVARGMSSKEIARDLGLSPRTVDLHVARAVKRLGAINRVDAVARALRSGSIELDD